ncbi:MAG: hypothetical protein ABW190_17735 [Rhizobacter sp.]
MFAAAAFAAAAFSAAAAFAALAFVPVAGVLAAATPVADLVSGARSCWRLDDEGAWWVAQAQSANDWSRQKAWRTVRIVKLKKADGLDKPAWAISMPRRVARTAFAARAQASGRWQELPGDRQPT